MTIENFLQLHKIFIRTVSTFILVALIISPVAPVFAQEATDPPAHSSSDVPPPDEVAPESAPSDSSSSDESLDDSMSQTEASAQDSDAEVSKEESDKEAVDDTVGLSSLLSVDSNKWLNSYSDNLHLPDFSHVSGAFTYNVDIHTPPGRNGIQPNLQLKYNSQNKDPENEFGVGWDLSIPYIEGINRTGWDDFYSGSFPRHFKSSLDGELATTTVGPDYMVMSDDGSLHKYYFPYGISDGWRMIDKNGTTYTFGTTSANQLADPSDSTHISRWMLDEVRDVNGNYIDYQYVKDNGQIYPSKITYTNSATTSAAFTVEFTLENRTDSPMSYGYGFKVQTLKRIEHIDVKKNGTLIHKFEFDYTTGDNTVKSLLSSITETGYDESASPTALPATSFTYQTRDETWSTTTPSPFNLPQLTDSSGVDAGYRVFNYQRDGKTQFILLKDAVTPVGYNPTDWSGVTVDSNAPKLVDGSNLDRGAWLADVNGDLFPDVVLGVLGSYHEVWLWTNGGIFASTTYSSPPNILSPSGNDRGVRYGDLNGDGYSDYILAKQDISATTFLNLADGTGWDSGGTSNLGYYFTGGSGSGVGYDFGFRIADINGDGLDDVVGRRQGGSPVMLINKGDGKSWEEDQLSTSDADIAPEITQSGGKDMGTRLADINGDGLIDFVVSTPSRGIHFYINMGDGLHWKDSSTTSIPYFLNSSDQDIGTRIMVGNYDGIPDFVTSSALASSANYTSNGKPVDVLKTVTLPQGGTIDVTYKGTAVDSVVFQTIDTITRNPHVSGQPSVTDTYTFSAGEFKTDFQNRRFRGFGIVEQTDSLGNSTKTYYYQGNGNNTGGTNQPYDSYALGEYNDTDAKMYYPYRIEKKTSGNSNFDSVEIDQLDTKSPSTNVSVVYSKNSLMMDYDGNSSHRDSAVSTDIATTTGNVIQKIQWGEANGSDNGTFSDLGSDKLITNISYATSSTIAVIGLPSVSTTTDNGSNTVAITRHYYDSLALGLVQKGLETKTESWKTGSSYASTTQTYNVYGLVATSTDARSKSTAFTYDSLFLYPATTTNAVSQSTGTTYNYDYGKVKETYDPNGRLFQTTYDGLGRTKEVKQPDIATPSTLVTKTLYTYTDNTNPSLVQKTDTLSAATSTNTYAYYDGLGRILQSRKTAENSNVVVKDYSYDNRGLLASESFPYFSTGTANAAATTSSALFSNYVYDALKRQTSVANAVGTTATAYDNWASTVTNPLGKTTTLYDDAFNNLVQVDEHNGASTYSTVYEYNGLNLLKKITDALGNVRNFTYDGMGRRLTAEDLHATSDGSYGTWTYAYDDANNLTQTVDPKSQTINYGYDNLSRLLTEDYTGSAGTEVTYTYDNCLDGKMRLCTASSTDAVFGYAYNPLGLIKSATSTVTGTSTVFTTQYQYDRQGDQTFITYPDNAQVAYLYNAAGLVDSVSKKESGDSASSTIVSNFDYAPTGQPTVIQYGNGVTSTNTYNPNAAYRLSGKVSTLPTSSRVQDLTYTYDALGNITQIVDVSNSATAKTTGYTYDDLSRLLTATTTNATTTPNYSYSYAYNALGNITSSPLGAYSYLGTNNANPHAVTAIATTTGGSPGVSTSTIAFDATSTNITTGTTGTTTKNWTHTVSGTNPIIVLTVNLQQTIAGIGSVGSASWNGGAFTKATSTRMSNMETEVWYLVATTTGAKTMSVTINGSTDSIRLGASSFTGVSPTWALDVVKTVTGSGGNPSLSITPTMATDVVVTSLSKSGGGAGGGVSTSTPTYIQSKKDTASGIATFTSSVTTGNLVVVALSIWNTTIPSNAITDNKGNTYTKAVEVINGTSLDHVAIFYAKNVNGGSTFTIGSSIGGVVTIHEYSGVATTSPLDKTTSSTGTSGTSLTSGNVTTSTSTELYFGAAWSGADGASWAAGGGYTLRQNETNNATAERIATEDLVITSATTTSARFTVGVSDAWADAIATFKPAVTGGGSSSADATSSQTALWKDFATSTFGGASYKIATTSVAITDTYTTAASQDWAMAAISLRPATTTSIGGGSVSTTTLTYDNDGNLTADGTYTYSWNYKNRMTQSGNGTATSTYGYDQDGNRIKVTEAGITTIFPSKLYNVMLGGAATSTKHIFANGLDLATIESTGTTTVTSGGGGGVSTSTIALDATSTSITTVFNNTITKTWTHTVTGSGAVLVLYADIFQDVPGVGAITSAKWNGGSFTKVGSTRSFGMESEIWYLVATTTGAKSMSVVITGDTDAIKMAVSSFTGISTTSPLDATSTATGTTGNPSISVTTATSSDLVAATLSRYSITNANTNRTSLYKDTTVETLGAASYQLAGTNGSYSDTYTGTAAEDWSMVMAAFKVATTSTGGGGGTSTTTASTTTRYIITDHLGSANIVTNASGVVVETLDYYPYGQARVDTKVAPYMGEKRKYIGEEFDASTGLNYLNARYQSPTRGNFINEDPTFWSKQNLVDPQSLNSYSYAGNNPLRFVDPLGLFILESGTVEKGDTLSAITSLLNKTYSTSYSVSTIATLNKISNPNLIFPGQKIVPSGSTPDVTSDLTSKLHQDAKDIGIQNPLYFKDKVQSGGDWDLKAQQGIYCSQSSCGGQKYDSYIFLGQQVRYDAPGNIHYGYVGSNTWYGTPSVLHHFAGSAQDRDNQTSTGDDPADADYINLGISLLKRGY